MPPKAAAKDAPVKDVAAPVENENAEEAKEIIEHGFGKFEYVNRASYAGNWKLINTKKMKHGHGKMTIPGLASGERTFGHEEYDGDWFEDKMHGFGRYQYTSGAVYTGQWVNGVMQGQGKMVNADGTSYEGQWSNNLMNGEGLYIDADKTPWEGIFVNGSYESKIQKKLKSEKQQLDRINLVKKCVLQFFTDFFDTFGRSDKKTFKENLSPFFAQADTCMDFVGEPYTKYEERAPDKWNEILKQFYDEGRVEVTVLSAKEDAQVVKSEAILCEQMREKKGGQIVEISAMIGEKCMQLVLVELPSLQWCLVICGEKAA